MTTQEIQKLYPVTPYLSGQDDFQDCPKNPEFLNSLRNIFQILCLCVSVSLSHCLSVSLSVLPLKHFCFLSRLFLFYFLLANLSWHIFVLMLVVCALFFSPEKSHWHLAADQRSVGKDVSPHACAMPEPLLASLCLACFSLESSRVLLHCSPVTWSHMSRLPPCTLGSSEPSPSLAFLRLTPALLLHLANTLKSSLLCALSKTSGSQQTSGLQTVGALKNVIME